MPTTQGRVADLLEKLANGEEVQLGEFSEQDQPVSDADEEAVLLRELADEVRAR